MKKIAALILALGLSLAALAQNVTLTGVVRDSAGQPIVGAFVVEQGTSNGTMTGVDGEFVLRAPKGSVVEITCIGYAGQTVAMSSDQELVIVLQDDTEMLEETVVIGYGVQKKSVVTASIAKVGADELEKSAQLRVDSALKGLAAGVNVTAGSGQPGAASRIRIRGVGTVNDSNPLYIVDGMPIGIDGIDYLNPNDIESIEVLKDAASGAVYGARAANGVILVTTKKGSKGKASVNYNFSYGLSSPWRLRDVLNASEYALLTNEGLINAGEAPIYPDPFAFGEGTDWQREVFNFNAPQQQHELSVSGASDKVNYYLSLGYVDQDGIVGGNFGRSNYERLTLRSNTNYTVWDSSSDRNFLNKLTLGSNLSYSKIDATSIDANGQFNTVVTSALAMSPILTVYADEDQAKAQAAAYGASMMTYGKNGQMYMIPGSSFNDMINPVAMLSLPGDKNWTHKFVANFSGELQLWDALKFRSSFGYDMGFWGSDGYNYMYYLSPAVKNDEHTAAWSSTNRNSTWQVENVLTYDKTLGAHSFSVLLGQSASAYSGANIGGSRWHLVDINKQLYTRTKMKFSRDVHSIGQIVLTIQSPSADEFVDYCFEHGQEIIDFLTKMEMNRLVKELDGKYSKVTAQLAKEKFNCTLHAPDELKSFKRGDNFFWTSSNGASAMVNIAMYTYPYEGPHTFNKQYVLAKRDSVMAANIPGTLPSMHMATDTLCTTCKPIVVHGQYAYEARGLWYMENDGMGGPFVSHSRVDTVRNLVVVVEGFVFAPEKMKRGLMRRMEGSLYTLNLPYEEEVEIKTTMEEVVITPQQRQEMREKQ